MTDQNWTRNKIKGSITEMICRLHFEAVNWTVWNNGFEHTIPEFASVRHRKGGQNESKIHGFLGQMPDFLVHYQKPIGSQDKHYFLLEVKFRAGITSPEKLDEFIVGLLWQYRHLLFRWHDTGIFSSISNDEWHGTARNQDTDTTDTLPRFGAALKNNGKKILPNLTHLPLLFYVVSLSRDGALSAHLVCPEFCDSEGFKWPIYALHDESEFQSDDDILSKVVPELRLVWQSQIRPGLEDMFPINARGVIASAESTLATSTSAKSHGTIDDPTPTITHEQFEKLFWAMIRRINRAPASNITKRAEILGDEEFWAALKSRNISKPSRLELAPFLQYFGIAAHSEKSTDKPQLKIQTTMFPASIYYVDLPPDFV